MAWNPITTTMITIGNFVKGEFTQAIKDCFEWIKDMVDNYLIHADGSVPMTGDLDMDNNDILDGATVVLRAGTGTGFNANGKDIACQNLNVNGVITGAPFIHGVVPKLCTRTTTSTSNNKQLIDNAGDIDFTEAITADKFIVYFPTLSQNRLFCIDAVIDANTLDLAETTKDSKTDMATFSVTSGAAYHLYKITDQFPGGNGWTKLKTLTWSAGSEATQNYSFKAALGGLNRRLIAVMFDRTNMADLMTATYLSQTLIHQGGGSLDPAYAFFWAETGTNNIAIAKTGTNGGATAEVWIEDVTLPEAYSA